VPWPDGQGNLKASCSLEAVVVPPIPSSALNAPICKFRQM
jgi:hypothetical protein